MKIQNKYRTLLIFLSFIILNSQFLFSTIRYVSKTGSSTPPYTTWETAADSIQECIDFSVAGDTIIVANGVYRESLIVDKYLWLIGSSMDSTVIDGTGLANPTINYQTDGYIKLFTIMGRGQGTSFTTCVRINLVNVVVENCKIINAYRGIALIWSSSVINLCLITDVVEGYLTGCDVDTCNPTIKNSVISLDNTGSYGIVMEAGDNTSLNNIVLGNQISERGIRSGIFFEPSTNIIKNTVVSGFNRSIDGNAEDTAIVHNNISMYGIERGFTINSKSDMRNNISAYNETGVVGPTSTNSDYNMYWGNNANSTENLGPNDIIADPMFVNDTIPVYGGTYDYHLQRFSPAIDVGDPNILDLDGTRSDIGVYGGLGGEMYSYLDLAPRAPVNVNANVDSNFIIVSWNRNTEADTSHYNIYRDTTANFIVDPTKLIASQLDTIYIEPIPQGIESLYYKITAVDNQGNESEPSEEVGVLITSVNEYELVVQDYILYQNYPNPFNPSTKIGYKLKERGYVKLMVYDIKGEMISVLVNEIQEAGYYEVEFNVQSPMSNVKAQLASGIYLYRIEVIGEGRIPRYSDMKKMILVK